MLDVLTHTVQISSVVADAGDKNPCSLYFLNILIDTTVGAYLVRQLNSVVDVRLAGSEQTRH